MDLNDLPDGASVFIDANIFIYHFTGLSTDCRDLLERSEQGEIISATGAHIILEILHRLMAIEAVSKGLITPGQPASKLKRNPQIVRALNDYNRCVEEIKRLWVQVHPVTSRQIRSSEMIRVAYGLMTNDSVSAAMMLNYEIVNIATLDSDLASVPGLNIYKPTDVP
ncbi:MAG TPA: type II toxin-antitoxin system VapC family toxin [Blastocatellia bacterium]|nr:type II toxin-antitoxin system VapC family toxin [Blastocatellia bacterium]